MGMTENLLSTTQWLITLVLFLLILVRAVRTIDWQAVRGITPCSTRSSGRR